MTSAKPTVESSFREFKWWILLVAGYIFFLLVLPANTITMHQYDLTAAEYKVLRFALALPSLAVWLAAFWGTSKLRQYSQTIRQSKEGEAFQQLSRGSTWLAWSLPIPAFSALILGSLAASHPGLRPLAIIVTNYLSLLLPLIAFVIIGVAARGIVGASKINLTHTGARILMLFFLLAGVLFCYMTFSKLDMAGLGNSQNAYFLPVWLVVITLIVPYLYAWFTGLLAAYEISLFAMDAKGVLYRKALVQLAVGIVLVIASLIVVQYLSSVQPRAFQFVIDFRLLIIIFCRIIGGIGFVFLALGAIKLKKIEDV